jgi:hypothetical protein
MSPELFVHTFNCLEEAGQTAAQPDGDIGSMMTVRDKGRTEPFLIPSLHMLRLGCVWLWFGQTQVRGASLFTMRKLMVTLKFMMLDNRRHADCYRVTITAEKKRAGRLAAQYVDWPLNALRILLLLTLGTLVSLLKQREDTGPVVVVEGRGGGGRCLPVVHVQPFS